MCRNIVARFFNQVHDGIGSQSHLAPFPPLTAENRRGSNSQVRPRLRSRRRQVGIRFQSPAMNAAPRNSHDPIVSYVVVRSLRRLHWCASGVQDLWDFGRDFAHKHNRFNRRYVSYRPFENAWHVGYNPFSLRCLSLIRNCVQIRSLCTRQQFLYHFLFLSVLKMRVVAGDSQIRIADLIFHEVTGHHARLHVADSTVSESVHSTRSKSEPLADWHEDPPKDVSVFQWRAEP